MDLSPAFRALSDNRRWVLAAGVLACVVGLLVGFRVSLSPPSVGSRSVEYGTASTKVLVDTQPSTLTDSGFLTDPLVTRAAVYAQLISTAPVRRLIARSSGIPSGEIAVDVPSNGQVLTNQPRPNRPDTGVQRSNEISGEHQTFRLDVDVEADLPVISLAAQAPDADQALRLANGAARGLAEYIRVLRPNQVRGRVVEVRRLGNAASGSAGGRTGLLAAVGVAVGVFFLLCLVIVTLVRMASPRPPGPDPYWDRLDVPQLPPPDPIPRREPAAARRGSNDVEHH